MYSYRHFLGPIYFNNFALIVGAGGRVGYTVNELKRNRYFPSYNIVNQWYHQGYGLKRRYLRVYLPVVTFVVLLFVSF